MKTKVLLFLFAFFLMQQSNSQEVLTFTGYDGATQTLTATTATVNDVITIVFEDTDIANNFYTSGQTFIHLYGGLQVDGTNDFQGAPSFTDLAAQPKLNLIASDTDANAGPNTYSLNINLSEVYTGVADGSNITGLNLLFQNQFGGGDNNQTVNLFIDLVDALKNSTLGTEDLTKNTISLNFIKNKILLKGLEYNQKFNLNVYDLSGRLVKKMNERSVLNLDGLSTSVYILKLKTDNNIIINKKVIKE